MTYNETETFCKEFNRFVHKDRILRKTDIQYGVAPTFVGLLPTRSMLTQKAIVGAQNACAKEKGAYTSQVSYAQLKEYSINYVILGHSEVRQYLHETDEDINAKAIKLLAEGMKPIICIGESLKQYESKKTISVLKQQITDDLKNIAAEKAADIIIAYEPI
ncbi:MAG: triose-phosphate isomerase, partial [Mycoplasmoidaceae bacterium]|nr:triose-phosphate isomerase [Mycoplasmoidaceae bacterium]